VVVWHDITEARRLLNERREHAETEARRALLQLILDELPTSVYLVRGHDARLVLANRAATMMWGAVWQIGQPMHEFLTENGLRVFGANGRPLVTEQLATRLVVQDDMSVTIRQHQETIRHPDGTTLPLLVNAVKLTIPNLDGLSAQTATHQRAKWEPVAVVVHQDVTALKEAEQLKDEFLSVAAHELRNPLLVLKGYAQMLLLQSARVKGSALAEWQAEALREIDLATQRLDELTEDLFDVTRLQAGQLVRTLSES
jgi:signal transduction histidine kinase